MATLGAEARLARVRAAGALRGDPARREAVPQLRQRGRRVLLYALFGHPQLGEPLDRSKLRKRFKAALVAADVRDVRFHDFRHTFGTRMAAAGVAIRTLQEWLGHRDLHTTQIYADYQPSTREADLVDDAFRRDEPAVAHDVGAISQASRPRTGGPLGAGRAETSRRPGRWMTAIPPPRRTAERGARQPGRA